MDTEPLLSANTAFERDLARQIARLLRGAVELERLHAEQIECAAPSARASARNLVHYLSLRQHDIRGLQQELLACGLSSLSNSEAHTMASLQSTLARLDPALAGGVEVPADFRSGPLLLSDHAARLLGPPRERRGTRIMVTMPTQAATDVGLVRELLLAGMDVMRINCAHDDADAWAAMARNLREVEGKMGRRCRIQADLAGPKLRTGPIAPLGEVLRLKPLRDAFGTVTAAARVELFPDVGEPGAEGRIAIDPALHARARDGDLMHFHDLRGKARELRVVLGSDGKLHGESDRTAYIGPGVEFALMRKGRTVAAGCAGALPVLALPIELHPGELLVLTRQELPGHGTLRDAAGTVVEPARIHCTLGEVFCQVRPGERVFFDDGKIGGTILSADDDSITLRITQASAHGSRLRAGKGINFPDSALRAAALGAKDLADLESVVAWADIVALSFLRRADDVQQLQDALARIGASERGIVLKIENREAFENLPEILLASLRSSPVGVMVARGDLAVEVGFDRLSEVQEEILWLCEAAHVPVIWATQMLEGLAKRGIPSRAEVTDAAMSGRAECAMLNKGPNIVGTTRFLSDILERMATHRTKRRPALRRLAVTHGF